jgi:hypothetical protein
VCGPAWRRRSEHLTCSHATISSLTLPPEFAQPAAGHAALLLHRRTAAAAAEELLNKCAVYCTFSYYLSLRELFRSRLISRQIGAAVVHSVAAPHSFSISTRLYYEMLAALDQGA